MKAKKNHSGARETFTKGDRLLKRSQFLGLSRTGKRLQNRYFIAAICKNKLDRCRLGITVTRRVGNAVTRNRIKRLARENFRLNRHMFRTYWDINLIAKSGCGDTTNRKVLSSLDQLFKKIADYESDK